MIPTGKNKQLCLALLYAESEQEVIRILKHWGYWDDDGAWRYFGDNENNWSQIGNQQGHPVAAMVEKLVNSIDAVLMRECQARGIAMEGPGAPQSIAEAQERFCGIKNGNLANIGAMKRTELAQDIGLIATGALGRSKQHPTYTVFDRGEGQTPRDMPETLLSLSKSNKLRIPFVQGKFNMGGTGVLRHGGKNRLQLIVSRRCPEIADTNDLTAPYWGFTIVRRQDPPQGARSSIFTYLAPNSEILTFENQELRMPNGVEDPASAPTIEWGTAIKLYEYNMKGYRSNIKLDLSDVISLRLPKPGLPIRFYEFRTINDKGSPLATMAGLLVRLEDDRGNNVEENFPTSYKLKTSGEPLQIDIFAFRKGAREKRFRGNDGIIFTINGQAHGSLSKRFFARQSVKMDYISQSLLVIVDATNISAAAREDLFMNSRDRLSEGDLRYAIERELERVIREDPLLKDLREKRRREAIAEKISDTKPIIDILDKILRKSPALEALFIKGKDLSNPFKSVAADIEQKPYIGEYFPTYFRLMKRYQGENERPISRQRIRVQFETDAPNDYFDRENDAGRLELQCNGHDVLDVVTNLHNGVATVNITLPKDRQVGDRLHYTTSVEDGFRIDPFSSCFAVIVTQPLAQPKGKGGKRLPPAIKGDGERSLPDGLAIPKIYEVRESEWGKHDFTRETALTVKSAGDDSFDYYVNLDNVYLNTEIKALRPIEDPVLLQHKFKYAMALLGMMVLKGATKPRDENLNDDHHFSPAEMVEEITTLVAPVILPMIEHLGALDIDEQ